jgi:hypothetical protein
VLGVTSSQRAPLLAAIRAEEVLVIMSIVGLVLRRLYAVASVLILICLLGIGAPVLSGGERAFAGESDRETDAIVAAPDGVQQCLD